MSSKKKSAARVESSAAETVIAAELKETQSELESEAIQSRKAERISSVLENLSEQELTRFEFYSHSKFNRNRIKDIIREALKGKDVDDETAIVVAGLAKLFVGELTDQALDVVRSSEDASTGVQPDHIREGYRRMCREGKLGKKADSFHPFNGAQSHHRVVSMDEIMEDS